VFTSYTARTAQAREAFAVGRYDEAVRLLQPKTQKGGDRLCYLLECATIRNAQGDFAASRDLFFAAREGIREFEERAVISARDVASGTASLLLNEKTIPYQGAGYEKILLHAYQALNFLFLGDPEGARVEIVNLGSRQEEERKKHDAEIEKARKDAQDQPENDRILAKLRETYRDAEQAARRTDNLYQNAFAYYLSSVVYELQGEPNDAYIDCRKVHELAPDFGPVRRDLVRLSGQLGMRSEQQEWEDRFGLKREAESKDEAELVVFAQCGEAPLREELRVALPFKDGWVAAAFPRLVSTRDPVSGVFLEVEGNGRADSEPLTDVEATAARHLYDRLPILALKQAIRTGLKGAATKKLKEEQGGWGSFLGSLAAVATEQADLRGWTTLPATFQAGRCSLSAGPHRFRVASRNAVGGALAQDTFEETLEAGDRLLLNIRAAGDTLRVHRIRYDRRGRVVR
jgi:hypothetical protein